MRKKMLGLLFGLVIVLSSFIPAIGSDASYRWKYNPMVKETFDENMTDIKVAILYQRITDGINHPSKIRTYEDLVNILKETNPDLVFRVWWRWIPTPESLPPDHPIYQAGHTYQQLEETLGKLKKDLPEIKFWFGSIPTQRINFEEKNPITGKTYSKKETWQMTLDPAKWGINFSKEKLQELAQQGPTGQYGYLPDVTNKEFQELYLSWAKRQIDAGVNGLFLDMLFAQPRILAEITKNLNHKAVKESLRAIDYLIEEIRKYGYEKGRYIYLCSWGTFTDFPDYTPDLDFVIVTPKVEEVRNLILDEERWNEKISKIKERLPKAKILAIIDWAGTTNTSLGVFSQELSKEAQREFLRIADGFLRRKGITFIYPVHGGFMGQDAKILSYGKSKTYDSLAPEFDTYGTIVELAKNRAHGNPLVSIERPRNCLYVFDKEIMSLKISVIIGKITIMVDTFDEDGINRVEFCIDDVLKFTDHDEPYSWLWNEFAIGWHVIKVIVYDNSGNKAEDRIKVMVFNLGLG